MKRIFSLSITLLLLISFAFSQGGKLQFEKTAHDFSQVKEEDGPVSYEFKFTNTGTAPVIISNVQASCGCTTPGWSKDPVPPGKTGFVKAQFDPMNRPGTFNKTLTVSSNAEPSILTLSIKGTVIPRIRTIADDYPDKLGALRFQSRFFSLGKIKNNATLVREYPVFNDSESVVSFLEQMDVPGHIKFSFEPKTLQPKEKGTIKLSFDPKALNDFGYVSERISIYTNEEKDSKKELVVAATIEEYFPAMTATELAESPRISFNMTEYDFGVVKEGDMVTTNFVLTNIGKKDLEIRKTKANCGCTVSEPEKDHLKPGESTNIKVTYNSAGKKGTETKEVTVFSNDPSGPARVLKIKANVTASGS